MSDINVSLVELRSILKEVYCVTGINFSEYAFSFLKRRTEDFMRANNILSDSDFIYKINKSAGFAGQFIEKMFVPNSELFRDAEIWNYLETKILTKLAGKQKIKIWLPYSTDGKELFSLLYVLGRFSHDSDIEIHVSAVTEKHLNIIKNGMFTNSDLKSSVKNIEILNSALDQDDVFQGENSSYTVKHIFQGEINYEVSGFINDEYVLEFDLIFCRNVFIYFNNELQIKAEKLLNRALKKGGYLFIGYCENLIFEKTKFKQVTKDLSIYKKKTLS